MTRLPIAALTAISLAAVTPVFAQLGPVNFIGLNFNPITTTTSYNYDWITGAMTLGTATGSMSAKQNTVRSQASDPTPPDPNGYGTFLGTARPVKDPTGGGSVLYEQSVCSEGYPTCINDGSITFGYMVMYPLRGSTLDQLTNLQTMYYVQSGCFGGGSPRFSILVSNGTQTSNLPEIQVYLGTYPAFNDCPAPGTWLSTGNLASDAAGLRWDTSQICPGTFYNTYSGAVMCANLLGYKINAILLGTDGGWTAPNAGTTTGQTFLFKEIQTNSLTRFPQ